VSLALLTAENYVTLAEMTDKLRARLRGVIAFPVTPFRSDLALDLPGLRANIQRLLEHPVSAVVAAGGTGEMYSLTPSEHCQVIKAIVEEVAHRVPVISGTGFNQQLGIELAQQSAKLGVDAILALPPYYPNSDDDALAEYYAGIGAATRLPLFVYSRDWVNPTPAWIERLAARIPNLEGWKEGQGDIRRYQQIMNRLGDRLYWIGGAGDDCVPAYYSIGIRAYTSSIATVAPKLSLLLHEVASIPEPAKMAQLMTDYVIPLYALRSKRKGYEVSVMKEMMNQLGMAAGPVRPPLPQVTADDKELVRKMLESWTPVLK
jgi:5-dehydro-4-deoxyglucarate dehydratase